MLGRPSFLISAAIICFLALYVLFYTLFGVEDGIIRLDAGPVTSIALFTAIVSLVLLVLGVMFRAASRPWKSETFVMR
jgi:hypothetical protein